MARAGPRRHWRRPRARVSPRRLPFARCPKPLHSKGSADCSAASLPAALIVPEVPRGLANMLLEIPPHVLETPEADVVVHEQYAGLDRLEGDGGVGAIGLEDAGTASWLDLARPCASAKRPRCQRRNVLPATPWARGSGACVFHRSPTRICTARRRSFPHEAVLPSSVTFTCRRLLAKPVDDAARDITRAAWSQHGKAPTRRIAGRRICRSGFWSRPAFPGLSGLVRARSARRRTCPGP